MWPRQGTNRLFYLLAALAAVLALTAQAEEHRDAELLGGQLSGPRRCVPVYCADEVEGHGRRVRRHPLSGLKLSGPRKCEPIYCADEPEDRGMRVRRQIVHPQQPLASPPSPSGGSDIFGFLSNLGPQVDSAQSSMKLFSSLFNSNSAQQQQPNSVPQAASLQQQQQSPLASLAPIASQLLSQISSLTRSTQSSSKDLADGAAQQAQSAQTGLQGALTEMMSGFQRIVASNPALLPEVKNLYQRVSSRLSSQVQPSPAPVPTGQSINDAIAAQMGR